MMISATIKPSNLVPRQPYHRNNSAGGGQPILYCARTCRSYNKCIPKLFTLLNPSSPSLAFKDLGCKVSGNNINHGAHSGGGGASVRGILRLEKKGSGH